MFTLSVVDGMKNQFTTAGWVTKHTVPSKGNS